jgi:hypothetical protein
MPSETEWRAKLRDLLNERIERRDVHLGLRVTADPAFPFDQFDDDEFAAWVEDWIGFSLAATSGPVMPGTTENEWVVGDDDLHVWVLMVRGADPSGNLVAD